MPGSAMLEAFLNFLLIFFGSTAIGYGSGVLIAIMFKYVLAECATYASSFHLT
jgi:hypothetical protein